jgi:hypothetical protein
LLNRKVGEEVEFEVHGVRHQHRIDSIVPYQPAPPATPTPAPDASPPGAPPQ